MCCISQLYIYEYYSAIKKKEILPFVTAWMNFEGIILSEISQTERQVLYQLYLESQTNS